LVRKAQGKYVVFVDDDDSVTGEYIESILLAAEKDCDCIVFNGWMTTDGQNRKDWYISKDLPYCASIKDGKEVYLRFPNHIVPIKREIALQVPFSNKTREEDYDFAVKLKELGLIKTETKIDKFLYHYKFLNIKP
jgi:glycosyltransferase involved in cell wall biosynthesis